MPKGVKMQSSDRPHDRPNRVARFFLWCAGSDLKILEKVPASESIKQIGRFDSALRSVAFMCT